MKQSYPFDPYQWQTIVPLFAALVDASTNEQDFMQWFDEWNALDLAVNDAWTYLKKLSYSDSTNVQVAEAYKTFTREMFSTYLGLQDALIRRALSLSPHPPSPDYEQLWRRWRNQTTLFHPDSVPLQAEISMLESSYRELMRTIEQLPGDTMAHWLSRRDELNQLMMHLLKLRKELANVCGEPSFLAFRWRELNRLDFTIEECQAFHRDAEEIVIPILLQLREAPISQVAIPEVDDPILHADIIERMVSRLDPSFGALFHDMRDGYLDLGSRAGKAMTSEQWFFPCKPMPYIHNTSANLGVTLHEYGHALHAHLSFQSHPSMWNYIGPDEFQEFVAVLMDMLCWPYYEQSQGGLYSMAESIAVRQSTLRDDYLVTIAWGVMGDVFEHWVYGNAPENITPDDLDAKWLELTKRFMPWKFEHSSELEVMTGWQRGNWSLFRMPLYTITYPIDTIAACLAGKQVQNNHAKVLEHYKAALKLGNTKPVNELFGAIGVSFPFSRQDVKDALHFAVDEYERLAHS